MKQFDYNYIAGLIEGDGHIHVPKTERGSGGKLVYPRITITFPTKDLRFVEGLKEHLKGSIYMRSKGNGGDIVFAGKENLVYIIGILNGRLRGSRVIKLYECIDWVNAKYGLNIPKLPPDTSPIGSNAWFAGFVDAEGCFCIRTTGNIQCYFEISQSLKCLDERCNKQLMQSIADFLNSKLSVTQSSPSYRVTAAKLSNLVKLSDYFGEYPLRTAKYLDYCDWIKALEIIKLGDHYSRKDEILALKSGMNSKRTYLNGDHLLQRLIIQLVEGFARKRR